MGELLPMRYRLAGNAVVYISQVPGSGIAPVVATAFVRYQPNVSWRGERVRTVTMSTTDTSRLLLPSYRS